MITASQIFRKFSEKSQCLFIATQNFSSKKRIPLITCKKKELDLYINGMPKKDKDGEIILASKGWQHYKSKGDHFTIHPTRSAGDILKRAKSYKELGLNEKLVKNLDEKQEITHATKLQLDCMQKIFNNRHVLLAAETGCGKVSNLQ